MSTRKWVGPTISFFQDKYNTATTYHQAYMILKLKWVREWMDILFVFLVCLGVNVGTGTEWTIEQGDKEKSYWTEFIRMVSDNKRTIYH